MRIKFIAFASLVLASCGGGSGGNSGNPVTVTPPPTNSAPQVNAGEDQTVIASSVVNLNGTAIDADGDNMQFSWTQMAGQPVTISNSTQTEASFTAPSLSTSGVLLFEFKATDDENASGTDEVQIEVNSSPQSSNCIVTTVPDSLRSAPFMLDGFYQKYCDVEGIPLLSSSVVRDAAFFAAHERAIAMSSNLEPAAKQAIIDLNTRIAIIAQSEVTTGIPEYSDLNTVFPETDWDTRTRGLGATPERPATSAGEENLLCLPNDIFAGEDIFVHEYAHTVHVMGIRPANPTFDSDLSAAYDAAIAQGLWEDTFAATNALEYWAEGVQSWFNVNQEPQDGIHNDIDTRVELQEYDPVLHDLIAQFMPTDYQPTCPE